MLFQRRIYKYGSLPSSPQHHTPACRFGSSPQHALTFPLSFLVSVQLRIDKYGSLPSSPQHHAPAYGFGSSPQRAGTSKGSSPGAIYSQEPPKTAPSYSFAPHGSIDLGMTRSRQDGSKVWTEVWGEGVGRCGKQGCSGESAGLCGMLLLAHAKNTTA